MTRGPAPTTSAAGSTRQSAGAWVALPPGRPRAAQLARSASRTPFRRAAHSRFASAGTSSNHPFSPRGDDLRRFLAPREQRPARSLLAGSVVCLLRLPGERPGQAKNVLRDLRLAIAHEERYATVERIDNTPAIADQHVVHLAADGVLDVRDPDPQGGVGAIEDQLDLVRRVAKLVGHLQEEAHVLDARDLER